MKYILISCLFLVSCFDKNVVEVKVKKPTLKITDVKEQVCDRVNVEDLKPSKNVYLIIADCEGYRDKPYNCGGYAIGFGHAIYGEEITHFRNNPITKEEGCKFLIDDVNHKAKQLKKHFKGLKLKQCEFDAMISISYNTGFAKFCSKDISKKLKQGYLPTEIDFFNTLTAYSKRVHKGLIKRRKKEYLMFNNNYVYTDRHKIKHIIDSYH